MAEQNDWAKELISEDTFDNDAWDTTLERYVIDKPTMQRIVATYNACAGVPTADLETVVSLGVAQYNVVKNIHADQGPIYTEAEVDEMVKAGEIEIGKVYRVQEVPRDDH